MRVEPEEPEGPCTLSVAILPDDRRVIHYDGLAPELTGGLDVRREMPPAVLVLVCPYGDGRWDVDRYADDGTYGGSTHHEDWSSMVEQIRNEYLSELAFTPVPDDVDEREYASELAARASEA